MVKVLLDTDVAIDYLRGIEYAKDLIMPLLVENTAYISVVSVYELYAGMRDKEKVYTENFVNACNIEVVTLEITTKGSELHRTYKSKGITLTMADCLIQATAILKDYKIATRNVKHYPDENILIKF